MDLNRCPFCGHKLPTKGETEALVEAQGFIETLREQHPEVGDDPQDGCENLVSPPLKRTHELRGDEGAESGDEMSGHSK